MVRSLFSNSVPDADSNVGGIQDVNPNGILSSDFNHAEDKAQDEQMNGKIHSSVMICTG
jgi:hypothetical protein